MTDAERTHHAIEFLERLQTLTEAEAEALVENHAGTELPGVLETYTEGLLNELAPLVPEAVRAQVLEEISSLMLLGYLVRANEEVARHEPTLGNA
ncbi:hypothetical protein LY474_34290 [Myxococcus stipitatus]|uniref:hypothetical protein n=1 Tax=Myxococcus stipitatus TaxID=83455 RepID=UPI001F36B559|nr:hypothetical protein [Myxococcus stipitatus]MCE9672888.1 hypothetical protein [Myxococcus stipitatus]